MAESQCGFCIDIHHVHTGIVLVELGRECQSDPSGTAGHDIDFEVEVC